MQPKTLAELIGKSWSIACKRIKHYEITRLATLAFLTGITFALVNTNIVIHASFPSTSILYGQVFGPAPEPGDGDDGTPTVGPGTASPEPGENPDGTPTVGPGNPAPEPGEQPDITPTVPPAKPAPEPGEQPEIVPLFQLVALQLSTKSSKSGGIRAMSSITPEPGEQPNPNPTNTNGTIPEGPDAPGVPGGTTLPNSPAPALTFLALSDNNASIPPDTQGAIGPNHVVTMLNTQVRIQSKNGATNLSTVTLQNFWTNVSATAQSVFGPKLTYDPYGGRWIATSMMDPGASSSSVLVGVSQSNDPTAGWYFRKIDADSANTLWADYPSLGFNKKWIVVQVNMYTMANAFSRSQIYLFNRTNFYAGGTNYTLITRSDIGATQAPVVTYDENLDTMYFVQMVNGNFNGQSYLRIFNITGAFGSEVLNNSATTNAVYAISDATWNSRPDPVDFLPQLGGTNKIHTGDARIRNAVYRNGSIWCAHTIFLPATSPSRAAAQWFELSTAGAVEQRGRVDDANSMIHYAYPTIAVNKWGDALLGYSRFSTNQYASANYSLREFYDQTELLRADYQFRAGDGVYSKTFTTNYTGNRWGDYTATVVDPSNDTDLWTLQEYAATPATSTNVINDKGRWATQWAKVVPDVPTNDNFANSITLSGGEGTRTNISLIRTTKETGESNHAVAAGNSVWFSWTAPTTGSVAFDTLGSDTSLDTLIGVYTGSAVNSISLVATNDNALRTLGSSVTFSATSGITYRIAVDAKNPTSGKVVLHWIQPTPPFFTLDPYSQNIIASNNVTFASEAIGTPSPTYQWRKNATNITGAASANYTINNVQSTHPGDYTVFASNSSGSVTSLVATLTVYNSATATLSAWGNANDNFTLTITGVPGYSYVVQASTNLVDWSAIETNTSPFTYTNAVTTNFPYRFFKAVY